MLTQKNIIQILKNPKNRNFFVFILAINFVLISLVTYESYDSYKSSVSKAFSQTQYISSIMSKQLELTFENLNHLLVEIQENTLKHRDHLSSEDGKFYQKILNEIKEKT